MELMCGRCGKGTELGFTLSSMATNQTWVLCPLCLVAVAQGISDKIQNRVNKEIADRN